MKVITEISLQNDGTLLLTGDGKSRSFDFNQNYKGFYPTCRWTAAGRGRLLYLAGTDENHVPRLFSSAEGEVWSEVNITSRYGLPDPREYGDVIRVLHNVSDSQIFLVTRNGYLVTLPDCTKCVRARHVSDQMLKDGKLEADDILLTDENGEKIRIPAATVMQYRCAFSFAKPFLNNGGLLFDLRSSREQQEMPVAAAISLNLEDMKGLLVKMPKNRPMFFFCTHGYLADQAVRDAREAGFDHAYSMGSIYDMMDD